VAQLVPSLTTHSNSLAAASGVSSPSMRVIGLKRARARDRDWLQS
jgi:hypothetical protein